MITAHELSRRLQNEHGIKLDESMAECILNVYELVSIEMDKSDEELVKSLTTLREKGQGFSDADVDLMKSHKLSDIEIITRSNPMLIKFYDGTEVSISGRGGNCGELRGYTTAKFIQQQFESNPNQTLLETLAMPLKDFKTHDMIVGLFPHIAGNILSETGVSIEPKKLIDNVFKVLTTEETRYHKLTYKIKSAIAFILQPFKFLGNKMVNAVVFMMQPFKSLFSKMFGANKTNPNSEPAVAVIPFNALDLQTACEHASDNESVSSSSVARTIDLNSDSSNDDVFAPTVGTESTRPSV